MNVLVDAMSARAGGGQTYLRSLLSQDLPFPDMRVFVLAPPSLRLPHLASGIERVEVAERYARPLPRLAWQRSALPQYLHDLAIDVAFFPSGTFPVRIKGRHRTVTMSRNMLPFDATQRVRYRPGYIRARLAVLRPLLLRSLLAADLVIFISQYAHDVLRRLSGDRLGPAVVIPHGVGQEFRQGGGGRPDWLPEDYLLYVSYIEPYKCQLELVRAFSALKRRRPGPEKLLLVGPHASKWYTRKVQEEIHVLGLDQDVHLTGQVAHDDLPAVNRHARLVLFPSACENCPNALLEGMAAGRPLVVSNRPPMPEFAADAALYADPSDLVGLAERMRALLDDQDLQDEMGRRAGERATNFDWADTASRTWAAIDELSRHGSAPRLARE